MSLKSMNLHFHFLKKINFVRQIFRGHDSDALRSRSFYCQKAINILPAYRQFPS